MILNLINKITGHGVYNKRIKMQPKGTCRFCTEENILCESHIIPRFVYNWLKETSVTGHLRAGATPNRRIQDGVKRYLLCKDCETMFSQWGKIFAEKIFVPFHQGESLEPYGPWLLKFAASVSWRVLALGKQENKLNRFSKEFLALSESALDTWKKFLKGEIKNLTSFEQHMILFPETVITDYDNLNIPANINQYLARSIDVNVIRSQHEALIYVKMCKIIIIGFIKINHNNTWHGSRIHVHCGNLMNIRYEISPSFGNFLFESAKKVAVSQSKISDRQWNRIEQDYKKNMDKFSESEMFRAINRDFLLFGNNMFE